MFKKKKKTFEQYNFANTINEIGSKLKLNNTNMMKKKEDKNRHKRVV